ncbi:MAG TPA: hypothetical protein VJ697_16555 [Nitrososphaeraceae archaeon]|nr:hypothetical protein [Nitrososphaeraceae archaeon]
MILSPQRSLEENIDDGIKTLEYHIKPQNYPIVNDMLQLQIETLQWVLNKQKNYSLEHLKQIVNFRIKKLEYELKIARGEIEHISRIIYQLEVLECCKIMINCDIQKNYKNAKENEISLIANNS